MSRLYAKMGTFLILCLPAAAIAQVDTSEWKCELCPFEGAYTADLKAGAINVSDSAARFGNSTGLDEDGIEADLGGSGRFANETFQLQWAAENLGLDSREFNVEAGRQGLYGLYLDYDELPYRRFDTTSTVYAIGAGNNLTLPAGWVTAGTTTAMTALPASLVDQNIGADRQTISLGGHILAANNFKIFADYSQQSRDGVDIVSGSNYTQASLLPRVVDYQTDTVNLGVTYANGPLNLALAWYGSFFENSSDSMAWENAFFDDPLTAGFESRQLALEPDNDFQQFSLSGSFRAATLDTIIAFSAASGQGEQNEPLLPYTVNPNLTASALPRSSIDGQVDTSNYSITLSSRPLPKGRVKLGYRYDERDNRTPRESWNRVITDTFLSGQSELNTPYSFERARFDASGEYRLLNTLRVSAGYERTELDRDFQEVAEQTEDHGWGRVKWRPIPWLNLSAKGGSAKREVDRYNENVAIDLGQNPLLRKYNLAHRYREFGEFSLSASPTGWPISATVTALFTDDSYSKSRVGLTDSESTHFSIDLSWAVSDSASVYLIGGRETIDADQFGSAQFGEPDWFAAHEDSFSHIGGGLEFRAIGEKTDLILDYSHTDGETAVGVGAVGSAVNQYPDLDSTLDSIRLKLRYAKSERLDIDAGFRYESFSSNDWALAGVEPNTIPAVLSLGADPYDYDVWVFSVSFRYLIGERDISFPE
ncbi:MAG: MtrB/PioB family decaheme-associated outer membrane protein [Woeseiaceae bacterium]